ncbi:MAG: hypothetical protein JXB62_20635 [Pirellulales bacterium]|nr:hypothetical protein [Pirellulales bacterium]
MSDDTIIEGPGQLEQLTERLAQLGDLLSQTNEQVVAYLLRRESQSTGDRDDGAAAALARKLDTLTDRLDAALNTSGTRPPSGGQEELGPALAQLGESVNQQFTALAEGIHQLGRILDAKLQTVTDWLRPAEPEEDAAGPAASSDWQRVIFGPELAERPSLKLQRQQLLDGLLRGDPAACALVGQLLIFRSAMTEKMPPLLKEIGEAYYRWQPKTQPGSNPMEEALVEWLDETMQDAGVPNTIELVHSGERFDSTRHTAATRGVEVTEVLGWIVLRDNGRVYTKANVAVR